jgi:hypothetical protein
MKKKKEKRTSKREFSLKKRIQNAMNSILVKKRSKNKNTKSKFNFLSQFAPFIPRIFANQSNTSVGVVGASGGGGMGGDTLMMISPQATTSATAPLINSRTLKFNYAIDDADICRAIESGDKEFFFLCRTQPKAIRAFRHARGTCFHFAVKCLQANICKVLVVIFGFGKWEFFYIF